MELKHLGFILRSTVSAWEDMAAEYKDSKDDYSRGRGDVFRGNAETITNLLNKCDVPELEPEDV